MRLEKTTVIALTGMLFGLAGCTTTTTGILLDAKTSAPVANAWVWSISETFDFLLQWPNSCETFGITRTASDGTFALIRPSSARFVSAFHPGFIPAQRGARATTKHDALYLESQITQRTINEAYVLTSGQQLHEYPVIAQAVKPRLAIFPLWREGEQPALTQNEKGSIYAFASIQSCSSDKGALQGTPPGARQELIDAVHNEAERKKMRGRRND